MTNFRLDMTPEELYRMERDKRKLVVEATDAQIEQARIILEAITDKEVNNAVREKRKRLY